MPSALTRTSGSTGASRRSSAATASAKPGAWPSGAILVEYVFNYPGVGYMLLQAVNNEDYPLMQALFLLITVTVLVAILLADIATAVFDPRTRTEG